VVVIVISVAIPAMMTMLSVAIVVLHDNSAIFGPRGRGVAKPSAASAANPKAPQGAVSAIVVRERPHQASCGNYRRVPGLP